MKKIGITGGIGSGKSTVAQVFKQLGIPVYEADSEAKKIIEEKPEVIKTIKRLLGNEAYNDEGKYQKQWVASQVFNQPELLQKLNQIVHPAVGKDFEEWCTKHSTMAYIIKEAAIMNKNQGLDKIIVVYSPVELRINRVKNRDNRTEEEIQKIITNQKSEKEFAALADFIIHNNEVDFIIPQVLKIHEELISK